MYCVDFVEIALFKSSGDIWQIADHLCLLHFFDELTVNKIDSGGFFSRTLVGKSSILTHH